MSPAIGVEIVEESLLFAQGPRLAQSPFLLPRIRAPFQVGAELASIGAKQGTEGMSEIEQPIMEYIAGVVAETGGGAVTRDTQLLEAGVLDSINLVRLIQFIEERFKISIPRTDLGPWSCSRSPATVSAYVAKRAA